MVLSFNAFKSPRKPCKRMSAGSPLQKKMDCILKVQIKLRHKYFHAREKLFPCHTKPAL
ncbi:hypothetical protein C8N30_2774 [Sulfitobacter guttiformis]|uniref:Uncharacterized protein n=1 Tax=Sulfitobacter guttiformis TaxID=74349 RepID=A0A420DHK1_9RHOB|nr:hypothetical protein C8N30_2774 [Sulfitobacter guttiformis]